MAKNYARAVSIDLGDWLHRNPPPCICEPKYDGFRVFLFKSGKKILFATRHGMIYSETSHPPLFKKILPLRESSKIPEKLILDGEFRSPDGLWIFDLLQVGEEDVTGRMLMERKKILMDTLAGDANFLLVQYKLANSFQEIMEFDANALRNDQEGILVKNPLSSYGQKEAWLKLKGADTADCFVIGIDRTIEMERTGIPHSWYIGVYESPGKILEMGKVGTYLKEIDPSKITIGTVVEIRFQKVTDDKKFRSPLIVKIREDKKKEECTYSDIEDLSRKRK